MKYKTKLSRLSSSDFINLKKKAEELTHAGSCCPNRCGIDRRKNTPPCHAQNGKIRVASFAVHRGEEPPVSGSSGAGNVFFSGCTMDCVFCQNYPFSQLNNGSDFSIREFADEIIKLQEKGVHNINLVTADQYILKIIEALELISNELTIPISYNCSGYHTMQLLSLVNSFADIFLYDVKYLSDDKSVLYSKRSNYYRSCITGLEYLLSENPNFILEKEFLVSGIIVRHLVLPGEGHETAEIINKIAILQKRFDFKFSLMFQYFPANKVVMDKKYAAINRKVSEKEYFHLVELVQTLGVEGWMQDLTSEGNC